MVRVNLAGPAWTPGPWYLDPSRVREGGAPLVRAGVSRLGRDRTIAQVNYDNGSDDPEVTHNARLIAAAPDLYEALEMVRDANLTDPHIPPAALAKIAAALAKAEGRA